MLTILLKKMKLTNQEIINKFFEYYVKRDLDSINSVVMDSVTWSFLGKHKLSGVKNGIKEVISFFDFMG